MCADFRIDRRTLLAGAGLVAVGVPAAAVVGAGRAEAAGTYDREQRFVRFVGGGNGILYGVQADGGLLWFRHTGWQTGAVTWANGGSARWVGSGWQQFRAVLGGFDGQLYGVRGSGELLWYRYVVTDLATGAGYWHANSGKVIGSGFGRFPRIFGGPDGVVYGVDAAGALWRYRYLNGSSGTGSWESGSGVRIGSGFLRYADLAADDSGVIYGISFGSVHWWRYLGAGSWAGGGSARGVGAFHDSARKGVFVGGGGAIYLVRPDIGPVPRHDDSLGWFRLSNYRTVHTDGRGIWANGLFTKIGSGFTVEPMAAMQGYATTPNLRAGETARIAISTTFASVTTSLVRLAPSAGGAVAVTTPTATPGRLQVLPAGYRSNGCGWQDSMTVPIPADWPSGVYAAQVDGPHGLRRHIPFVVRPASPTAPFAVVLPTNTYHAYNDWGGHDQYSADMPGGRRTFSFQRPSHVAQVEPTGMVNHTWYSDLLLLRWMTRQGISYDCYTDADLHASPDWLYSYPTLVLATHPEYWSDTMRSNALDYVASGGKLIYTGGNGVYERVEFSADRSALTFRNAQGNRDYFGNHGLPASQLLGVNYTGTGWMTFAPYRVVREHPLLEGTGLKVGDLFARTGYNGAGSGWEFDTFLGYDGEAASTDVIAQGQNGEAGATMVFAERPGGGWVFSASSMAFNGCLDTDPATSRLLRNVFTLAESTAPPQARRKAPVRRTAPLPPQREDAHP